MRICIREREKSRPIVILLPTRLLCSPIAGAILRCATGKLTTAQWCRLLRALRRSARVLRGTPLVEVQEADGDSVRIYL